MGKGFYVSKPLVAVCVVLGIGAVATIIALSVVYANEKSSNKETSIPTGPSPTGSTTDSTTDSTTNSPPTTTPSTPKEPWEKFRLPDSLVPISYNVTLWPRLKPNENQLYIFTGNSTVIFECKNETDLILIHSNRLNLTTFDGHHAKLTALNGTEAPRLKKTWPEVSTQYLVIQLDSKLQVGTKYELFTDFVGELADDLGGFYRSEYMEDGEKK